MARHHHRHVSVEAPEGWDVHTLVSFCGPVLTHKYVAPPLPNISMMWETMREGDTFRLHVDRKLAGLGKRVANLEVGGSSVVAVSGRTAEQVRYRWTSPVIGKVDETMTLVPPEPLGGQQPQTSGESGGAVALFTAAASPDAADETNARLVDLLRTVRFGGPPQPFDAKARYHDARVSFEPPPGWFDSSILTLNGPEPDPAWIFLVMDRLQDETLRVCAGARLAALARRDPRIEVLSSHAIQVAGRTAIETRFRRPASATRGAEGGEGELSQSLVLVDRAEGSDEIVRFDLVAPAALAAQADQALERVLTSVHFGVPAPQRPPVAPFSRGLSEAPPSMPMPGRQR